MSAQVSYSAGPQSWQQRAACRGPHAQVIFYPPVRSERKDEKAARERQAKAICAACPVAAECLDYALNRREQHGIWGGLTELERRAAFPARSA